MRRKERRRKEKKWVENKRKGTQGGRKGRKKEGDEETSEK